MNIQCLFQPCWIGDDGKHSGRESVDQVILHIASWDAGYILLIASGAGIMTKAAIRYTTRLIRLLFFYTIGVAWLGHVHNARTFVRLLRGVNKCPLGRLHRFILISLRFVWGFLYGFTKLDATFLSSTNKGQNKILLLGILRVRSDNGTKSRDLLVRRSQWARFVLHL